MVRRGRFCSLFIVVYPSGTTLRGGGTGVWPKVWLLRPEANLAANVRFISTLIDTLEAAYNIDPTRIYVNGFSNGGAMAFALSCRLSDRIAAVGTVSAAQDQPWSWCADSRPVPLINFHGTTDLVPYNGGKVWAAPRPFPSVSTWTANWARRNRCGPHPIESVVAADVTRLEYTNCADDAAVVLYTIREEAIPGLAASRCRSGCWDTLAAASTPRVRCGRSFASTSF